MMRVARRCSVTSPSFSYFAIRRSFTTSYRARAHALSLVMLAPRFQGDEVGAAIDALSEPAMSHDFSLYYGLMPPRAISAASRPIGDIS